MKDRNMKENKFDIFHVLLQTYGFKEKIGFIFNSLQSVLSQLVLGGISWYIFDVLFKNDGNIYISIIFLLFVTIYFIFF